MRLISQCLSEGRCSSYPWACLLLAFAILLSGCGRASGGGEGGETSIVATEPKSEPKATVAPPPKPERPPATLIGAFRIAEVEHDGVITIIRSENTTQITFFRDGTFNRVSLLGGRMDHNDSGEWEEEGADTIVLRIKMSRGKMQSPSVIKRHRYKLSQDGEELRMMAEGKTAVFRRVASTSGG